MKRLRQLTFVVLVIGVGGALWAYVAIAIVSRVSPPLRSAGFGMGEINPLVSGLTPDGRPIRVDTSRSALLYVFSPSCGWCKQNHQNLLALSRSVDRDLQFVGVALMSESAPEAYKKAMTDYLNDFPFPGAVMFVDPLNLAPEAQRAVRTTPQLLVVSSGGEIQRAWVGALIGKRKAEAEQFFMVHLPGIPGEE